MTFSPLALLLLLCHTACSKQPEAPSPVSAPLREVPWGQLNFLHTTDTHGWHAGHLQEPQYSADWGDYISFACHLRHRADSDNSDLLLIDTGDRVEGNGLYDASDPKGKYTFDIFKQQRIDVVTPGNHELYLANSSRREFDEVVPDFKDSYIASNLEIYNPKTGKLEALAPRYRKFTTKNQGIHVLAFGFLFNFHGNANSTVVQPVQETVNEQWFQDAIRTQNIDLFLVAGHVPLRDSEEFDLIYKTIRQVQWDTPIVFFAGHTHIRDFRKYEKKAYGIESGRYMETLGFLSISGLTSGKDAVGAENGLEYKRLYIDNNLYSMHHHSGTNASTFDTDLGKNVSQTIHAARMELKLDHTYGCAPQDYWLNRAPYPSGSSLLTLLDQHVIPDTFSKADKPSIVITNSGAMRFDIFKGPFTIDSTFLVSPFTSSFRKIKDVPYGAASQVLQLINNEGPISLKDLVVFAEVEEVEGFGDHKLQDLMPSLPPVNLRALRRSDSFEPLPFASKQQTPILGDGGGENEPLIPGYTSLDDAGNDGDDTLHQAIQFYDVPNCIGANIGFDPTTVVDKPEAVDLVYNEFIQDWVLAGLRFLGQKYEKSQTEEALEGKTMTEAISNWVRQHWHCKE